MAMILFTALSGLSVFFLLYVLVQFWKEGRRSERQSTRGQVIQFSSKSKPTVVVVTRPISHRAHTGLSLVSKPVRMNGAQERQLCQDSTDLADETFMPLFSALTAPRGLKRT
jgi:hypothetical protein